MLAGHPLGRVLVTRLRYLGDVVMSTVVVDALRRGDADLDIGFLCEEAHAPVLAGQPGLSRIHVLKAGGRSRDARARISNRSGRDARDPRSRGTLAMVSELRAARYDLAVDLFFNPRSAWLLKLAGVPLRIGGARGSRRHLYTHGAEAEEMRVRRPDRPPLGPGVLGDHLSRLGPLVHAPSGLAFCDWYAQSGGGGRPRLAGRPMAPERATELLKAAGLGSGAGFLVLAPGATWATKRWPLDHWLALAAGLRDSWPGQVVILAPPGRSWLLAPLTATLESDRVALLPELALPEVLDLLAASCGLITVDGGVMHAAVALGVPTLALFGPTDPNLWFPYENSGPFRVLATRPPCHPCDLLECEAFVCLPDLSPPTVLAAALEMFPAGPWGQSAGKHE